MIKTYIYGVPNGFDFYEKDAEFNDYFKGFYIASRRGRRLMINRRDNGETVYSYLRYGMKEVERQPLHSFFGMSMVIDNYQFCPNFKVLLEWFDYLFDKLVNEHQIIHKDSNDIYHYRIHKFDENISDVEWLKSNIPNILTQSEETKLLKYDASFSDGKAGQIVNFNHSVGESRLLNTFKEYRWISLSSDIIKDTDIGTTAEDNSGGVIELNYRELNETLNYFNQQLLPIAVDISKGSVDELARMSKNVQEITASIGKYLSSIADREEKDIFKGLCTKYDSLKNSIETLLSKVSSGSILPPPETQYCFSCKQNKPISCFRSPDATKCIECENMTGANQNKTCTKCGKRKPIEAFGKDKDICIECNGENKRKAKSPKVKPSWLGFYLTQKNVKAVLLSLVIVTVIVSAVIYIPKECSDKPVAAADDNGNVGSTDVVDNNKVVRSELEGLISKNDFKTIYEYLKDKDDKDNYKQQLKEAVEQHIWNIIDASDNNEAAEVVLKFYLDNKDFLSFIGFTKADEDKWTQVITDYKTLWSILRQAKITEEDLNKGRTILQKYNGLFREEWKNTLEGKPKDKPVPVREESKNKGKSNYGTVFKLTYTKASDGNTTTVDNITSVRGFEAKQGTNAVIECQNGIIQENNQQKITVNLKEERPYKINCGNGITITLTAKKMNKFVTSDNIN